METIQTPAFLQEIERDPDIQILDVRTAAEYRSLRLRAGSVNIPLDQVRADKIADLFRNKDKPIYVICRTENRSVKAVQTLEAQGVKNLIAVQGGVASCAENGADMAGGEAMDLQRQTQIAAGLVTLTGFLLGAFVNDAFYALCGFVGAGLVVSGATGWCGMAMMLAKAPWNRG